jgi:hypothetical protein
MNFELHSDDGILACCGRCETALWLARAWLQDAAQQSAGVQTCVVQIRDDGGRLLGDHIVALSGGPLAAGTGPRMLGE